MITPAVSGPFDLGTVVVRVALNVNPETAQINAVSDPIPDVFGGVKLDLRSINLNMNRYKFMLNPTNCSAGATAGTINGGGGNPPTTRMEQLLGVRAVPGDRMQQARFQADASRPALTVRPRGPRTRRSGRSLKPEAAMPTSPARR